MVVKCVHKIVLSKNGDTLWEKEDRRKRICLSFIDKMLDENWLQEDGSCEDSVSVLFKHLKESKRLNIRHLVNYAFTRGD